MRFLLLVFIQFFFINLICKKNLERKLTSDEETVYRLFFVVTYLGMWIVASIYIIIA